MNKIDKTNEIKNAHENLIDTYLTKVKQSYIVLPVNGKQEILQGLEGLLDLSKKETIRFDPLRAREIRKKDKLTQKELADKLEVKQQHISLAETSGDISHYSTFTEKYFDWLKSKGYNLQ